MTDAQFADEYAFFLTDLSVTELHAAANPNGEPHLNWYVGYAPEKEDELDARVVIGSLHFVGADGRGDVSVASLFFDNKGHGYDEDSIADVLAASEATETLYDFARVTLASALATVGATIDLPYKSPDPEISTLRKAERDEDSDDSSPEGPSA